MGNWNVGGLKLKCQMLGASLAQMGHVWLHSYIWWQGVSTLGTVLYFYFFTKENFLFWWIEREGIWEDSGITIQLFPNYFIFLHIISLLSHLHTSDAVVIRQGLQLQVSEARTILDKSQKSGLSKSIAWTILTDLYWIPKALIGSIIFSFFPIWKTEGLPVWTQL